MMMSIPEWINLIKKSFEDTKGIIRSSKSKKDRQYNSYKKKDKITENDHDTKNLKPWATWKPQKTRGGGGIGGHHFLNFLFIILITPRETKLLELLCLALLYYD